MHRTNGHVGKIEYRVNTWSNTNPNGMLGFALSLVPAIILSGVELCVSGVAD